MIIERNGNDFTLTYEERFDKPERYFCGGTMDDFICLLCNSIELDFDFPEDSIYEFAGARVYNYNTGMEYLITNKDVKDFYEGKPIHLYGN